MVIEIKSSNRISYIDNQQIDYIVEHGNGAIDISASVSITTRQSIDNLMLKKSNFLKIKKHSINMKNVSHIMLNPSNNRVSFVFKRNESLYVDYSFTEKQLKLMIKTFREVSSGWSIGYTKGAKK